MRNPLIAESVKETAENTQEALDALVELLAERHSGLARLMSPIAQALEWIAEQDQNSR